MLFSQSFWPGIRDGSITLTFRRWKRAQVIAGRRYRTAAGILEVESIDAVEPASITDHEAHRSGFTSAAALVRDLRDNPNSQLFRIAFHLVDEPDPRTTLAESDTLSADDVADIATRLARLDRASVHGAWTAAVLGAIAANPGVRAGDLADQFGRERLAFKTDVRKLKNLGLTLSLTVGYQLSPRGEAYLRATR